MARMIINEELHRSRKNHLLDMVEKELSSVKEDLNKDLGTNVEKALLYRFCERITLIGIRNKDGFE